MGIRLWTFQFFYNLTNPRSNKRAYEENRRKKLGLLCKKPPLGGLLMPFRKDMVNFIFMIRDEFAPPHTTPTHSHSDREYPTSKITATLLLTVKLLIMEYIYWLYQDLFSVRSLLIFVETLTYTAGCVWVRAVKQYTHEKTNGPSF